MRAHSSCLSPSAEVHPVDWTDDKNINIQYNIDVLAADVGAANTAASCPKVRLPATHIENSLKVFSNPVRNETIEGPTGVYWEASDDDGELEENALEWKQLIHYKWVCFDNWTGTQIGFHSRAVV